MSIVLLCSRVTYMTLQFILVQSFRPADSCQTCRNDIHDAATMILAAHTPWAIQLVATTTSSLEIASSPIEILMDRVAVPLVLACARLMTPLEPLQCYGCVDRRGLAPPWRYKAQG